MDSVVIKSGNTSSTLTFSERDGDYFAVTYESPAAKIHKRVWGYNDCKYLVNLFKFIAKEWRGWEGTETWESIEGEFGISARCDNLGHIMLEIIIKECDGPEVWSSITSLGIDSGQTETIVTKVSQFFAN